MPYSEKIRCDSALNRNSKSPAQTESAQFKLDGLVLMIEGVGRAKTDGKVSLQALGLISFDDDTGTYKMRAFNDGRWLETEVKLVDGGNSILGALHSAHSRRHRAAH